jgi:hypothetical protein
VTATAFEPDITKAAADKVGLWARMFAADDASAVVSAAERYIKRGKFPPTIADIRAYMPSDKPLDVWREVYQLLNSGVAPDKPEQAYARMSPACKAATLAVGGWHALSMSPENDPHIRREFAKAAEASIATMPKLGEDESGRFQLGG